MTRQMLGKPDMPVLGGKDMRLTVAQAIRANTWGAAYGIGVEDQNLFDNGAQDIYKANVELTMIDGVVRRGRVYEYVLTEPLFPVA